MDGDLSHKIRRCLLLERKVMTNLDSILKSRGEGPLGTPLGLVHWKRASSPVEAGTAGYL